MTSRKPRPFEVWRLPFVYEEDTTRSKERPTIVGVVDSSAGDALVVKVTGHGPRPEYSGEVRIEDWEEAGLDKPSTARCSKTMIVPLEAFEGARMYGRLSTEDARRVDAALREAGKIL